MTATATAPGAPLVVARGLRKQFGAFVAVDGIDFEIHRGEVFGFLGPNGAGKTSTMRMIGCVSERTGGDLTVLDRPASTKASDIKARLGVVPQEDTLDTELSVVENLIIYGRFFGIGMPELLRRAEELLRFVELWDRRNDRVEPLSGGMKRRLTIARALISNPELILLDEPTTGLDPQARHALWDRLYRLKQRGVTQILTTHYMDEAEQLCDRLVVMDKATIVDEGSPRELIARHATREVVELRFGPDGPDGQIDRIRSVADRVEVLPDRVLLYTDHADVTTEAVARVGAQPTSVLVRRATLEDVFLHLTGRTLVD